MYKAVYITSGIDVVQERNFNDLTEARAFIAGKAWGVVLQVTSSTTVTDVTT